MAVHKPAEISEADWPSKWGDPQNAGDWWREGGVIRNGEKNTAAPSSSRGAVNCSLTTLVDG